MPHRRNRHVLPLILKRLKFSPVIALQGARQTGKSFLARDILAKSLKLAKYVTFDSQATASYAQTHPESFLSGYQDHHPLIIDEAQKAPAIFDAVKLSVDEDRRPGRYLLLGSTEFSHLTRVRESLTGRMGRIRLYPLTIGEAHNLPLRHFRLGKLFSDHPRISRAQLLKHLSLGGMPGIFSVRDEAERMRLLEDWLKLTCERDALQFHGVKIDPELCFLILEQIARLDEPSAGHIAAALLRDLRRIKIHLQVLETLFIVQRVSPRTGHRGKPVYYLLDAAMAHYLGASLYKCLLTLIKAELDALLATHDEPRTTMTGFRARAGGTIHFVIETPREVAAIKVLKSEALDLREIAILKSFQNQITGKKLYCYALGGGRFSLKKEKIEVYPWESVG
jgi:predicted AAA+ superfamily ATPase